MFPTSSNSIMELSPLQHSSFKIFYRAIVQITDLEDFVPLIELNVKHNEAVLRGQAEAKTLKWGEEIEKFLPSPDYILFADCIYYEEVIW